MAIKSSDQLTVLDLTDGVSVILTNDSHTFPGSTAAALASSTATTIIAMRGTEQIPAAVVNANIVAPTGVTTSVDTDPALCALERRSIFQRLGEGDWQVFGAHGMKRDYRLRIED